MKQLKIHSQKVNGKYFRDPTNQRLLDNWLAEQPDGCIEETFRRAVKAKTNKQLGAHFGLLILTAIERANDSGIDTSSFLRELVRDDLPSGVGLTKDFLKEIFYLLCPIYRDGKRISLSRASTQEASKHFEDCRNLLASHGIEVDEPNPMWRENLTTALKD